MRILCAILCGFLLDLLLADPAWMPHPVVWMGKAISLLERGLRALLPKTPRGEFWGGVILAVLLPVGTLIISGGVCLLADWIHPVLGFLVQTLWCWQALALRGLSVESGKVRMELEKGDLPAARRAVGRIVGRDTDALTAEGVTRAAVETVAENFSDGVAAPLFYMLIGGAPLALVYKSINTMDSMVGYKNDRYLYFGRAAARLDDAGQPICPPGSQPCSGSRRLLSPDTTARGPGKSGGGTAGTTQAQTPPRPSRPAPGRWASNWPGPPFILASGMTSPPSATPCAPSSRRTLRAPIGCCTRRRSWRWWSGAVCGR